MTTRNIKLHKDVKNNKVFQLHLTESEELRDRISTLQHAGKLAPKVHLQVAKIALKRYIDPLWETYIQNKNREEARARLDALPDHLKSAGSVLAALSPAERASIMEALS